MNTSEYKIQERNPKSLNKNYEEKVYQQRFRDDYTPADPYDEEGLVATRYTRAYLHHLWKAKEPIVHGLLTLHNIKYMADLMRDLRAAVWRDEI